MGYTIIKLNVVLNDNDHEWEFVNKNKNDTPKIIIRFTEEFECDLYLNDETMTNSIRLRYIPTAEEIEEKERVYGKKYTDYPEE